MPQKKDTRTLPATILQELRGQIVSLRKRGKTNRQVAQSLDVSERHASAVWQRYLREGNMAILSRQRGRKAGQCKKLGMQQDRQVLDLLLKKPLDLGISGELWTREKMQQAIKQHLKIDVSIRTVGERLKLWGMVPEKPIVLNSESNPPKIQKWISNEYQKLMELVQQEDGEIHWCLEKPIRGCKSGPECLDYYLASFPMLASTTNKGQIRFKLCLTNVTNESYIEFLSQLIAEVPDKKVFLLVKRILCLYMDRKVEQWLEPNKERIEVVYLPV